jgi:ribosomal protein S18 acetylase RimI-like enzyme
MPPSAAPAALRVETVAPADWPSLASFVYAHNCVDGDVRCLHIHAGVDAAAYAEELRTLPADEARFVAAYRGGELIGVAGAEIDFAIGRAWLRGPLVAAGLDFSVVATALLETLCGQLPAVVVRHDAFVNENCAEALAFFRSQGFGGEAVFDEFAANGPAPLAPPPPGVQLVAAERRWRGSIGALHDSEFPSGYVTADGLFAPDTADEMTRVALVDGEPAGYVRAHFDPQWQEGYVDFLAVLAAFRGRGVGRALLTEALRWSFARPETTAVTLTVRKDRLAARALYASVGFQSVRTAVGLRRAVPRGG